MSRRDLFLYLGRSITNLLAMKLWIFALTTTGMNEATALGYTGPLWVFLMARYIIGEKFGFSILGLIFINIIGMLIIIQPKYVDLHWQGIAASLGAILLWSLYEIICKIQTSTQHYMQQTFYFMAISAIIVAPFAYNSWKSLNIQESNMMIVLALLAVANITAIFIAYSHAPITLLSPFSYARLIFTVILTSSLYNIIPAPHTFIGAAVIFLSNGYFIYKINKKSLN
ncbi:MAG: DMT family transporter, partial [Pseudomonadota bacterium]